MVDRQGVAMEHEEEYNVMLNSQVSPKEMHASCCNIAHFEPQEARPLMKKVHRPFRFPFVSLAYPYTELGLGILLGVTCTLGD